MKTEPWEYQHCSFAMILKSVTPTHDLPLGHEVTETTGPQQLKRQNSVTGMQQAQLHWGQSMVFQVGWELYRYNKQAKAGLWYYERQHIKQWAPVQQYSGIHIGCICSNMNTHISENLRNVLTLQSRRRASDPVSHIHQRLNDVHVKHTILLPQVQNTKNFALTRRIKGTPLWHSCVLFFVRIWDSKTKCNYLIILWAMVKVLKGICEVL